MVSLLVQLQHDDVRFAAPWFTSTEVVDRDEQQQPPVVRRDEFATTASALYPARSIAERTSSTVSSSACPGTRTCRAATSISTSTPAGSWAWAIARRIRWAQPPHVISRTLKWTMWASFGWFTFWLWTLPRWEGQGLTEFNRIEDRKAANEPSAGGVSTS